MVPFLTTQPVDALIAELATRQHAMIALGQLVRLGLGGRAVTARVAGGRLHRIHQGVFAVGHTRITEHGHWMAAVLAAGPGGALSHLSAARLWGLSTWTPPVIHVIATGRRRVRGTWVHRCSTAPDERTEIDGIPVTTLSRTLFDCAGVLPPYRLEKLLQEAEFLRMTDTLSLDALLRRYPGHRGVARARLVLERRRFGASVTKEEMELRFQKVVEDYGLPAPVLNGVISAGGRDFEVDCHWPDGRVIVELDGRSAHQTTDAFEKDRARDRALQVAGWNVIRITWRQLHDEPAKIVADIRALLRGTAG